MGGTDRSLLELFGDRQPHTRAELVKQSGMARATVEQRLAALVERQWVVPLGTALATGGRPAEAFLLNRGNGVLLVADVGSSHARMAVTDLFGDRLAVSDHDLDVNRGPAPVLELIHAEFRRLVDEAGHSRDAVRAIAIGLPGPVDVATGTVIHPPTMRKWDGCVVPEHFRGEYDIPIVVDKDANIMALGEHRYLAEPVDDLLLIKIGMGVGAGIIARGEVYRGMYGMAGDLGHQPQPGGVPCRCGQVGCAEATAGAWAISRDLRRRGRKGVHTSADVVTLVRQLDPVALALVRDAGRRIGEVAAYAISVINPGAIIVAGDLAAAHEPLMAGIREKIYQCSHPLLTERLAILPSRLGHDAGLTGAAQAAADAALAHFGT